MVRKHRYFERNNALLQKLADLFEQFTVGANGLHVTAASSEAEWNRNSGVAWDAWCEFPDLTSRQPFGTIQSLIARRWFIDGESFIQLTRGRDDRGFRPRIQLIEAHRVATPISMAALEGKTVVDGVAIDERGRPIGYWVQNSFNGDSFELVPADQMIHVLEPSRPGEYRGIIFGHAVLNDLHDLDDLQLLEMDAAKENAKVSRVIETANGELSEDEVQRGTDEQVAADSGDITAIRRWYKETFGGEVEVMMRGDKYHQHAGERPSVVTQGYWDYLCSKICAGYGISKLLVYPWKTFQRM
jgi:capsid protein